jgi:5-methylcytosine-specific restriction endonuclease McrA
MTRELLIGRDGGICVWCGRRPWTADLTAEHLLPRSRRGRTLPKNLAVACRACNKRRRTKPVVAYVRAQRADGFEPRMDLLGSALRRMSRSESSAHVHYARRQLALLERL